MASFLRLQSHLQGPKSLLASSRPTSVLSGQRTYAQSTGSESKSRTTHQDAEARGKQDNSPNHPIPSNNAQPTLRDGKKSPIADMEGNLKEDLPQDVKEHNEDVENRYDRPYNHTADDGKTAPAWERK